MAAAVPALSRRTVLRAGLATAVGLGVGVPLGLGVGGSSSTGRVLPSRRALPEPFVAPLRIPPVLAPVHSDATGDAYAITQSRTAGTILPATTTEIWGYDGRFPGPTIVTRRGRTALVTHTNALPVPTVVHLHGGRTPADSDGYPTDLVHPGTRRTYRYPGDQRAATLWYHDHRMDFTGPSVWRGLVGFHLVRDDEEDGLQLPAGPRELPLMLTDRSFDADGAFLYPSLDPTLRTTPGVEPAYAAGVLGDVMLVNGTPWPATRVERAGYRLRILNACNARRVDLHLHPPPEGGFAQVGTDGGLLGRPLHHDHVELAPAQRVDVVVDFSGYAPGTVVTLSNDLGVGRTASVMRFTVVDSAVEPVRLPTHLSDVEVLTPPPGAIVRTLAFQSGHLHGMPGWLINGRPFSPDTVMASPRLGSVEVWRLVTDLHHPIHLHGAPFQVVSRGLSGPGPYDAGWKDTIDLRPAEEAAVAVRFDGYPGRYVVHCHNLEHEDMAMMGSVVVGA